MAPIPRTQCVVQVLEQAEAAIVAELPGILSAFATESGLSLSGPDSTWRSRHMPTGAYGSGVGVWDASVVYTPVDAQASGAMDADHVIVATVLLSPAVLVGATLADASGLSAYEDAQRWYCWAVATCLQQHLPTASYAGPHGVIICDPIETAPQPPVYSDDGNSIMYERVELRMRVLQRVRRY